METKSVDKRILSNPLVPNADVVECARSDEKSSKA